jgi:hypothetical protein
MLAESKTRWKEQVGSVPRNQDLGGDLRVLLDWGCMQGGGGGGGGCP